MTQNVFFAPFYSSCVVLLLCDRPDDSRVPGSRLAWRSSHVFIHLTIPTHHNSSNMVAKRLILDAATELLKLAINILTTARTTVETSQLHVVDGIVDVPVATQRQDPTFERVQKTVNVPQVQYVDEPVDVPVVIQSPVPTIQTVVDSGEMPQTQHIDKVIDVPVGLRRQVVDVPVPQIQEQTVEVVKILPERVQQRSVEQIVGVPVPAATAQERTSECIAEQIVGTSVVQQSRQTPLEDTLPTWDKPAYEPQFDLAEGAVGVSEVCCPLPSEG